MRVFVTGASGWVGSAVVPELTAAGHEVVGLARSDASASALAAAGAAAVRGELGDADVLRVAAKDCDGVIHLAFIHDFSDFQTAIDADRAAITALCEALEDSGKPLVVTSGTPAIPGRVATELDSAVPGSPVAGRDENARVALDFAARGVRASVIRLPRSVHGDGDRHGFLARLIAMARDRGTSGYVGDGASRWPAVHVKDAAVLFRVALEKAAAGSVLHAVGDEGVPTLDIATVIGRHLGVPTTERAPEHFGFLGSLMATDQPASSTLTRQTLGWTPTRPGLIEDLEAGHYFGG